MAKLTLTDIASGYQAVAAINANNELIEQAMENTLSRNGQVPNHMLTHLDMNSFRILNLPNAVDNREPITLAQAAAIAGVTVPLTRTAVGDVFYPLSSAEVASGLIDADVIKYWEYGNVLRYKAVRDGVTDDSGAFAKALAANNFFYAPQGVYALNSAIVLSTNQSGYGDGKELTHIVTLVNTIDAFKIGTADNSGGVSTVDSRRNVLSRLSIHSYAATPIGANNAAIRFDDATSGSRGLVDAYLYELYIGGLGTGFKYGLYGDDLVWNNTFSNLWLQDNETNVKLIGSSNINNLWQRCYFHESNATTQHIFIQHAKQNVFQNCNFGGRKVQGFSETKSVIEFANTVTSMKFEGCNFENFRFGTSGLSIIAAGDGCSVDVDSSTFVEIDADAGITAYYLRANNNSLITVRNSCTQLEGTTGTLYHFGAEGPNGKIEVYDYIPVGVTVPTSHGMTTLADIGAVTGIIRFHNVPAQQLISPEYNLDATGTVKDVLLSTNKPIQIGRVHLLYTEGTSADAGIQIAVQADTDANFTADSTITTITTEINKGTGTRTEGTLVTPKINTAPNGITLFTSANLNKVGVGKCRVVVDFWYRGGN